MKIQKGVFNSVRMIDNYAVTNGIGTSNRGLGAIVMFIALLAGYVRNGPD